VPGDLHVPERQLSQSAYGRKGSIAATAATTKRHMDKPSKAAEMQQKPSDNKKPTPKSGLFA